MDQPLVIAVIGLAAALAAALYVMRRRADEIDLLRTTAARAAEGIRMGEPSLPGGAATPPNLPIDGSTGPHPVDALLPVGLIHLDELRHVDRANARAHALLGATPGRLLGRSVMEAFLDARTEALVAGVAAGGTASGELRVGDGGNDSRVLAVRVHRPPGAGTWMVLEDITELRRLQQIRSEFIDNVSHELRTPLSTVSLLAETLAREAQAADVPERMRERISKIEIETGHLVQMVNELLDLARIEGGSPLGLDDDVDLAALAEASVDRLRLFADRGGVSLTVETEAGLPPVRGDEARLGQVLVNLVHNAIKFSPGGGDVRVAVGRAGAEVVCAVADHGIGISPADQARIFERFYKADRARASGGGTGLGLSIARHVIEGHGGRIWVESEPGRGSTFSIALPLAQPTPVETASNPASPASTA